MVSRKKLVAEHALALFVENGVANTSIQHIIKRSGISKGTFYNYFSSKTECIEEILEQARYDAALMRSELMIGRDEKDLKVLAEQVGVLSQINHQRGLDKLFEELLHNGDAELKNLVLRQRIAEFEWFSSRLIEIFGESIHPYAFEASIIFYGMTQHILFTSKIINQQFINSADVSKQTLHYLTKIIDSLLNENTAILDYEKLKAFRQLHYNKIRVSFEDIQEKLSSLTSANLTNGQAQIVEAVKEEFQLEHPRPVVMNALLKAFTVQFVDSVYEADVKTLASYIWYSLEKN